MGRRSSQEWQNIITQHEASGLLVIDFSIQQKLNTKYFYARRRTLLKRQQRNVAKPFVKLSKPSTHGALMTLQFGDATLSLPASTEPGWLAQVIKALSA